MVVDGDDEEEDTHICPIMCVELLSGGILKFNCLEGRQNWGTLDTRPCGQFEV
jgi:hypothetical protein